MFAIEKVLNSSQFISTESIQFWYPQFHQDCCAQNVKQYCKDLLNLYGNSNCTEGKKQKIEMITQTRVFFTAIGEEKHFL